MLLHFLLYAITFISPVLILLGCLHLYQKTRLKSVQIMIIGTILTFIKVIFSTIPDSIYYNNGVYTNNLIYKIIKLINTINFLGFTAFGIGLILFINAYIIPRYKTTISSSSFTRNDPDERS